MYYVSFWNGKHIINFWCENLKALNVALEISGYVPDDVHFIKIKYCESVVKYNDNLEEFV